MIIYTDSVGHKKLLRHHARWQACFFKNYLYLFPREGAQLQISSVSWNWRHKFAHKRLRFSRAMKCTLKLLALPISSANIGRALSMLRSINRKELAPISDTDLFKYARVYHKLSGCNRRSAHVLSSCLCTHKCVCHLNLWDNKYLLGAFWGVRAQISPHVWFWVFETKRNKIRISGNWTFTRYKLRKKKNTEIPLRNKLRETPSQFHQKQTPITRSPTYKRSATM